MKLLTLKKAILLIIGVCVISTIYPSTKTIAIGTILIIHLFILSKKNMETLYVIRTTKIELQQKTREDLLNVPNEIYVNSNSNGIVNWEHASPYTLDELLKRGNIKIVEQS